MSAVNARPATSANSGASDACGPAAGSVGGLCPHCDEPIAIPDLLEAAETPAELEVITMPDR